MPYYTLFHPDTEIAGQTIRDFECAVDDERLVDILEQYGLKYVQSGVWYPAQPWIDALNVITHIEGSAFCLVTIGIRQIELARMPREFNSLPLVEILARLEHARRLSYRGSDIGSISSQQLGPRHVRVRVRSFEPDDLWYGYLYGIMRRFTAPGTDFLIAFAPDSLRRDQGGYFTVFDITWAPTHDE